MKFKLLPLSALALLTFLSAARAACPTASVTVKDGAGTSQVFCIGGGAGALINQNQIVDGSGGVNLLGINSSGQITIANSSFAATQSGNWNINNISGTVNLPTGASTAALQSTGNTTLSTINTTLGSPMQTTGGTVQLVAGTALAGAFNVYQGGVAVATGNALFVQPGTSATFPVSAVSLPLPSGAATSNNQTGGGQKTQIVDGLGNVIGATANAFNVDCVAGCSSSTSVTTWGGGTLGAMANYGTSPGAVLVPGVNAFITNAPSVVQATASSLNATVVNAGTFAVQDSTTETNTTTLAGAVSSSLFQDNVADWAGTVLGAPANYGTSPGAVKVPGVNAFITNTPSMSGSGIFQVSPTTSANTAANPFSTGLSIGGAILSATNGIYTNLLQGNAVLSGTNPLFTELSDGTRVGTIKAGSTAAIAGDTSLVFQLNPSQPNLTTPLNVALAANQSTNLAQVAGSTAATAATGTLKVGIVGNAGATIDAAPGAAPSNAVAIQGVASMTPVATTQAPSSSSTIGITPVVSASAESSHVLKSSGGNLYSLYITTGAISGYLMTFNATSAPADGAVTPIDCIQVAATSTWGMATNGAPPDVYSTGITAVFSTTGCFTKTASATAFFKGRVQ